MLSRSIGPRALDEAQALDEHNAFPTRTWLYSRLMAARRRPIELDEALIQRARDADGARGKSDTEVVEDALVVYLGLRALDEAQSLGALEAEEADRLAVDEVRAVRRARDAAA